MRLCFYKLQCGGILSFHKRRFAHTYPWLCIQLTISAENRHITIQAKQWLLFNDKTPWQKRNSNTLFDVIMGSYEGAETCELVGCYLLSQLTQIPEIHWHRPVPWWRPGGSKSDPQKIENAKKEICRIFTNNNLWITIQANTFLLCNARPDHWEIQAIFKTRDHPSLCAQ